MPLGEGQKSVTLMAKNLKLTKGGAWHPPPDWELPKSRACICLCHIDSLRCPGQGSAHRAAGA